MDGIARRLKRAFGRPGLWIPALIAAPILWALLPGGLPNTADGRVHFTRAAEMVHAWQDGVLIPRWSENLGLGYGLPLFIYAPPLPYQVSALLHTVPGLPLDVAVKGMMALGVLSAAYGAYRLGASLLGAWAGAACAAAFLYAPIMLRELFIQGNIAQYLAWTFSPWAAWALIRVYTAHTVRRRMAYAAALAFALVGTLLSHNAAALLLMGMIAGLAFVLFLATRDLRSLVFAAAGSLLGLALSAWFWAPALLEGKYVALQRIVASDFRLRFIPLAELIAPSPRLDAGAIDPYFPLTLGAVQVWLGIAGALLFVATLASRLPAVPTEPAYAGARANRALRGAGVFFILFTAFCALMATAWSEPIWTILPYMGMFEWPFRWHGFTAVGLAWLAAFAVYGSGRLRPRAETAAALITLGLLMGSALVNLYPHKLPLGRDASPAAVVRFEVRTNAIGTTSLGEFNPIWAEAVFNTSPLVEDYQAGNPIDRLPRPLPPGATGRQTHSSVHRQEFQIDLPEPATLTLNLFYFPGWRAAVDGMPATIRPHAGSGLMDVDLPAGEHSLVLTFGGTPLRMAAAAVSTLAWLGLIATAAIALHTRRRTQADEPDGRRAEDGRTALAVAIIVAAILLIRATQAGRLQLHSPPDTALPAAQPLHVDFEDKLRLLGIDPPAQVVRPDSALTVVAYWRALRSLDENYSVFLHLDDPFTGETVATVDPMHPSDIPTSGWAPGLYVRNPLKLAIPDRIDPIQYALRLGVIDRSTGRRLDRADGAGDLFEVGRVWVSQEHAARPSGGQQINFGEDITLLGAEFDEQAAELALYWRAKLPVAADYSVFVHMLDSAGNMLGQADGAPYANRYPTGAWRPGQIIVDRRTLAATVPDVTQIDRIAVGLYDPASGVRLPAFAADGARLAGDALLLTLESLR